MPCDDLLREHGLEQAVGADLEFPTSSLRSFLAAAAARANDPFLGLHVAQKLERGRYGMAEFAARSARDVRSAVGQLAKFGRLINQAAEYEVVERGASFAITHRLPQDPAGLGRPANEYTLAALCSGLREITGRAISPERVWFSHPRPRGSLGPLVEHFGTSRLEFSEATNGLAYPAELLSLPVVSSDPALAAELSAHSERLLAAARRPDEALSRAVRAELRKLLAKATGDEPGIEQVARALALSARTLQRRLAEEESTFAGLLDDERRQLARALLADARLSLAEVASRLGYSEPRAFQRAFKRWTGTTPGQFRRAE